MFAAIVEGVLAVIDWTYVLVALIAGLPAILAALQAWKNGQQLKTPSRTSIGKQIEDTQHIALANHYRIRSMTNGLDIPDSEHAQAEAAKADNIIHDDEGRPHVRDDPEH